MADNRFRVQPPQDNEDWLMSYADMITLLLSFFVLLISMSHIDPVKFEKLQGGMARDIGRHQAAQPLQELKTEVGEVLRGLKLEDDKVSLGSDQRGLVLEFDAGTFFESASAKLKDEYLPVIAKLSETLNSPRYSAFQIEVQGHTDDTPVNTPAFPTNWELSTTRATNVVRTFIQGGIDPTRLAAEGFADTRPKVSNRDMNGHPLPANQAVNRRVSVHIFPR
ncbi:flagellar motor protein MotB [Telmatospirillum sp.]|uniref:OmpA/MotB family protein n=1 Tax=Telmatospirillum sp. TaxID=2079197 RepID=UPI00284BA80E|nr:flagellar motor protein MotB [Telmatospirillum sp.]MDR3439311.1 OmpA family protein [Telmatospirillum sp.]